MEEEYKPADRQFMRRFANLTPNVHATAVDFPISPDARFSFLGTSSQPARRQTKLSETPTSTRTSPLGTKTPVPKTSHSRSQSVASNSKLEQLLTRLEGKPDIESQLEFDKPKPGQQEAKIKILMRKLREKDTLISELEDKVSRASEDAKTRNNQIAEYKQIIEEYDFRLQGLLDKTNASLERVVVQKNAEIAKLKEDLAAALELEKGKAFQTRKEHKEKLVSVEKEMEKQSHLMRLVQDENRKLMEDYSSAQTELSKIKQKLTDSHLLSKTDYKLLEAHFQDLEQMQDSLLQENETLRANSQEKQRENEAKSAQVSSACNLIYKARVDLGQMTRALRVMRQTPNFNALTVLLALKTEPKGGTEISPFEQLTRDLELLLHDIKDMETSVVDWYSETDGKSCSIT